MSDEIFNKLTRGSQKILKEAQRIAQSNSSPISTEYILLTIIEVPGTLSHDILREYDVNADQVRLAFSLDPKRFSRSSEKITRNAKQALKDAFRIAEEFGHYNIDTEHLLISLLSTSTFGSFKVIEKIGLDPLQIKNQLVNIFYDLGEMDEMIKRQTIGPQPNRMEEFETGPDLPGPVPPMPQMGPPASYPRSKSAKALDYFGTNLVEKARKGEIEPVIGRSTEMTRAIQMLLRKTKNNPVFIGDSGVGKTAIVEGLAQKIADKKVPHKLLGKKIYSLDMGLLIAGTMYRGQFEERLKKVLNEAKSDKDIIIFIDELHTIVGTGSAEGSLDAANLIKPALSKGELRLIGATTADEYRKNIEKDSALERRLQPILVRKPTVDETEQILQGIKSIYEKHHGLKIEKSALAAAAKLSEKYFRDRALPDKAIDLLDEAAASKVVSSPNAQSSEAKDISEKINRLTETKERLILEEKFEEAARAKQEETILREKEEKYQSKLNETVTDKDIARLVSSITGIPLGELIEEEAKRFLNLEAEISKYIVGQKEAIREISRALIRNRSGIRSQNRPIGSFIFMGPSGVGKTELARVLARHIYNRDSALIKIDMSEFMERHNLSRLTGSPPGYVGYEEAGRLTESVRKNPYSIILFDEIEKAHPEVFNIMLQILDEGKLTDATGREVDFRNTIVIMTSNIGLEEYKSISRVGFDLAEQNEEKISQLKGKVSEKIFQIFRPELINRIDKVIVFDPLLKDELYQIAQLKLDEISKRLKEQKIDVEFKSRLAKHLAQQKFDKAFGARPLIRYIEEKIEVFLSEKILAGKIKKNTKTIIDFNGKIITR